MNEQCGTLGIITVDRRSTTIDTSAACPTDRNKSSAQHPKRVFPIATVTLHGLRELNTSTCPIRAIQIRALDA